MGQRFETKASRGVFQANTRLTKAHDRAKIRWHLATSSIMSFAQNEATFAEKPELGCNLTAIQLVFLSIIERT